jgi:hypothetical protein
MKTIQSYRIEDIQIEQLDKLVDYYKENQLIPMRMSKATILEHIIRQEYIKVFGEAPAFVKTIKLEGEEE